MKRLWHEQDKSHVALSPKEAVEIAQAIFQATEAYPDCEIEVRFCEEDGAIRWFVKAKPTGTEF
jgi:hypothetical protein